MNNELAKTDYPIMLPDAELSLLADKIVEEIEDGKRALAISISETIKMTYWRIGRHIVEFEQDGNKRAKYGTAMLSNLTKILRARVGRGYSRPNLNSMRKFYLMFPKCQTSDKSSQNFQTSEKLTWSHICELITIDDELEREFYTKERCGKAQRYRADEYVSWLLCEGRECRRRQSTHWYHPVALQRRTDGRVRHIRHG